MTLAYVGAISHAPQITAYYDRAEPAQARRFSDGAAVMRERIKAARLDVLVVVSPDHLTNLPPGMMPALCIALADEYQGPIETWINLETRRVSGHAAFAKELLNAALDGNFDPAFTTSLELEHATMIPLHFLTPEMDVPIVPVIQNCMVPPLPRMRRCHALGELIRDVAERSTLRVGVVGTGGLSHAPGAPEAERIDVEFDRMFVSQIAGDHPSSILDIPSQRIDEAGFGTWEVRQWATALGAASGCRATIHCYEPVDAWVTGCAAATFDIKK